MRKINFLKNFKLSKKYWALALGAVSILTIGTTCAILSSCNEETNIEKIINKKVSEYKNNLKQNIVESKQEINFNANNNESEIKDDESSGIEFKATILKQEYNDWVDSKVQEGLNSKQIAAELKNLDLSMYNGVNDTYAFLKIFINHKVDQKIISDSKDKSDDEKTNIENDYNEIRDQMIAAIDLAKQMKITIESKEFSQLFTSIFNILTAESVTAGDTHSEFIKVMEQILLNNVTEKLNFSKFENNLMSEGGQNIYPQIKNYLNMYFNPNGLNQDIFCDKTRNDTNTKTIINQLFQNISYDKLNSITTGPDGNPITIKSSSSISYLSNNNSNPINILLNEIPNAIGVNNFKDHFQLGIKFDIDKDDWYGETEAFGFSKLFNGFEQDTWEYSAKFKLCITYSDSKFVQHDYDDYVFIPTDDDTHDATFYLNIKNYITASDHENNVFGIKDYFNEIPLDISKPCNKIKIIPANGLDDVNGLLTYQDFITGFTNDDGTNHPQIKPEYCDNTNLLIGTQLSPIIKFITGTYNNNTHEVVYNDQEEQLDHDFEVQDKESYGALNHPWDFSFDKYGDYGHRNTSTKIVVKGNIASYDTQMVSGKIECTVHLNLWVSIPAALNRSSLEEYKDNPNLDWYQLPDSISKIVLHDSPQVEKLRSQLVAITEEFKETYQKVFDLFDEPTLNKIKSTRGLMLASAIAQTAAAVAAAVQAAIYTALVVITFGATATSAVVAWIFFGLAVGITVVYWMQYAGFKKDSDVVFQGLEELRQEFAQLDFEDMKYGTLIDFTNGNNYDDFVKNCQKNIEGLESLYTNPFSSHMIQNMMTTMVTKMTSILFTVLNFVFGIGLIIGVAAVVVWDIVYLATGLVAKLFPVLFQASCAWAVPVAFAIIATIFALNIVLIGLTFKTYVLNNELNDKFMPYTTFDM